MNGILFRFGFDCFFFVSPYQDKSVAFKIFELGLKKYGDIPEYILAYIDYLSHLNGTLFVHSYVFFMSNCLYMLYRQIYVGTVLSPVIYP